VLGTFGTTTHGGQLRFAVAHRAGVVAHGAGCCRTSRGVFYHIALGVAESRAGYPGTSRGGVVARLVGVLLGEFGAPLGGLKRRFMETNPEEEVAV